MRNSRADGSARFPRTPNTAHSPCGCNGDRRAGRSGRLRATVRLPHRPRPARSECLRENACPRPRGRCGSCRAGRCRRSAPSRTSSSGRHDRAGAMRPRRRVAASPCGRCCRRHSPPCRPANLYVSGTSIAKHRAKNTINKNNH